MSTDTQTLTLLAGVVIPLLVGLLAKARAHPGLKALLNAALTAAAGALTLPGPFTARGFAAAWATTWVVSVATYYGILRPTGVAGAVQRSTANVGVG